MPRRKEPDCAALEPSLMAYIAGEPHPRIPRLVAHLRVCEECRREEAELRATEAALEVALASPEAARIAGSCRRPVRRERGLRWITVHAAPAAAVAVIGCALLLGGRSDLPGLSHGSCPASHRYRPAGEAPRATSLFGAPAASAGRSFDGTELDGRLEWIAFRLKRLGGDPW